MSTLPTIVMATRNMGKAAEFARAVDHLPVKLVSLADFDPFPDPVEDGATFLENAFLKASDTAQHTGLPALADDSGLSTMALDGAPGIHSARFAGPAASDDENIDLLLEKLSGCENRSAWFTCALCLVAPDGTRLWQGEGKCHGAIGLERVGSGGFGYDPLFLYPPTRKTFAVMNADEKFRVSHRGEAVRLFRQALAAGIPGL